MVPRERSSPGCAVRWPRAVFISGGRKTGGTFSHGKGTSTVRAHSDSGVVLVWVVSRGSFIVTVFDHLLHQLCDGLVLFAWVISRLGGGRVVISVITLRLATIHAIALWMAAGVSGGVGYR